MSSSTNHSSQDHEGHDAQPAGGEQDRARHSGEGAASALAQLKSQARQHRRQVGDYEEAGGGPSQ